MRNILQKLCGKLTNHKFRKAWAYSEGITPTEYHYKCKICGCRFWNYKAFSEKDMKKLKGEKG